jgi:hypothetical protein
LSNKLNSDTTKPLTARFWKPLTQPKFARAKLQNSIFCKKPHFSKRHNALCCVLFFELMFSSFHFWNCFEISMKKNSQTSKLN